MRSLLSLLPFGSCFVGAFLIWSFFRIFERQKIAKPAFTKSLADLIETRGSIFSVLTAIPDLFITAFDTMFTENILSIRGFFRSAQISLLTVLLLLILWYSTKPKNTPIWIGIEPSPLSPERMCLLSCYAVNALINTDGRMWVTAQLLLPGLLAPFMYNFLVDWIALMITRQSLVYIAAMGNIYMIVLLLILSGCFLVVLAYLGFAVFTTIIDLLIGYPVVISEFFEPTPLMKWIAFPFYNIAPSVLGTWTVHTINGVFVLSTLLGIFWIFIFSLAVILSNLSLKFEGLGPWIQRNFYVRKRPYKILAGLLVIIFFIPCVVWHLFAALLDL